MDQETEFRELFRSLIDRLRLSPEIAQIILQRIIQILSGDFEEQEHAKANRGNPSLGSEESEGTNNEMS